MAYDRYQDYWAEVDPKAETREDAYQKGFVDGMKKERKSSDFFNSITSIDDFRKKIDYYLIRTKLHISDVENLMKEDETNILYRLEMINRLILKNKEEKI